MKTSDKGKATLAIEEGRRERLYDDLTSKTILTAASAKGNPTIGVGHLVSKTDKRYDGVALTNSQIDSLLSVDLRIAENAVRNNVKVPLTQNQFDALVSLIFNVGVGKAGGKGGIITLADGRPSTLLRKLNAKDYGGAALQFLEWKLSAGQPILLSRRQREMALFNTPDVMDEPLDSLRA